MSVDQTGVPSRVGTSPTRSAASVPPPKRQAVSLDVAQSINDGKAAASADAAAAVPEQQAGSAPVPAASGPDKPKDSGGGGAPSS